MKKAHLWQNQECFVILRCGHFSLEINYLLFWPHTASTASKWKVSKIRQFFGKKLSKLKGCLFIKLLKELKIIIFTSVTSRLLIWPHRPQRGLGVFFWFQKFTFSLGLLFIQKNFLIFDTFHSEAVEAVWGQKSRHMFSRLKCPHLRITKHPWFHHEGAFFTLL